LVTFQRTRRKWIIDRQTGFVAEELKEDLGDWVRRQLESNIPRHEDESHTLIADCDLTIAELRHEWETQYAMQTSVRQCTYRSFTDLSTDTFTTWSLTITIDTGKLLENRLNKISSWQSQLYDCNEEFARVISRFTKEDDTPENRDYILRLEKVKVQFQEKVNNLYVDLGLVKEYPALASVNGDFVKTLLLCRDKKIELRKAATSVLNEMSNLDDAAHRNHNPLGNVLFSINHGLPLDTHSSGAE
jgi:hypothetical protein